MIFKLRDRLTGLHIETTVFAGPDVDHLANCGALRMRPGEWYMFSQAIEAGIRRSVGSVIRRPDASGVRDELIAKYGSNVFQENPSPTKPRGKRGTYRTKAKK